MGRKKAAPQFDAIGRVRRAIANARKEEARRATEAAQAESGPPAV